MLRRPLLDDQLKGKKQATRKPLLVDGALQVGKTYLIEQIFGQGHFRNVHPLDFRKEPGPERIFADTLEPRSLLLNIELQSGNHTDLAHDLNFFDEVGDCQGALDSLKDFAESCPQAFVCATGSNIALLDSFPVGLVRTLELFPLCIEGLLVARAGERSWTHSATESADRQSTNTSGPSCLTTISSGSGHTLRTRLRQVRREASRATHRSGVFERATPTSLQPGRLHASVPFQGCRRALARLPGPVRPDRVASRCEARANVLSDQR